MNETDRNPDDTIHAHEAGGKADPNQAYAEENDNIGSISGDVNIVSDYAADDGSLDNFSTALDTAFNALAENDGWEEGYDY